MKQLRYDIIDDTMLYSVFGANEVQLTGLYIAYHWQWQVSDVPRSEKLYNRKQLDILSPNNNRYCQMLK